MTSYSKILNATNDAPPNRKKLKTKTTYPLQSRDDNRMTGFGSGGRQRSSSVSTTTNVKHAVKNLFAFIKSKRKSNGVLSSNPEKQEVKTSSKNGYGTCQ